MAPGQMSCPLCREAADLLRTGVQGGRYECRACGARFTVDLRYLAAAIQERAALRGLTVAESRPEPRAPGQPLVLTVYPEAGGSG